MSKNTAVEWLVTELRNQIAKGTLDAIAISKLKMQAKAMEREQIVDSWENGFSSNQGVSTYGYSDRYQNTAEKFYNETYKGGEQ